MALSKFKSLCQIKQKIIVSKDKGNPQKHIANNINEDEVYQYKVDGTIIQEGLRCDYLVWNERKKHIYYIELKGSDLEHALEQLDATEKTLKERFPMEMKSCKQVSYRVVLNKYRVPKTYSHKEKVFKKRHLGDLAYGNLEYKESI